MICGNLAKGKSSHCSQFISIVRSRFLNCLGSPSALIDIIDKAPEVGAVPIEARHRDLVYQYKQIEGEQQKLNDKIAEEKRLRGESNDLARQIEQIEKSGHKEGLQNYRERQQQLSQLDNLEIQWKEMSDRLFEVGRSIAPGHFDEQHFTEDANFLEFLKTTKPEMADHQ